MSSPPAAGRPGGVRTTWQALLGVALSILLGWSAVQPTAALAGRRSGRHGAKVPVAELLKTAQAQQDSNDRVAARATLEHAYQLAPSAEVLCALAVLAQKDGRLVEAYDALRRCMTVQGAAPALPDSGELAVLGPRRALVFVDDHVVGALPLARPLLLLAGTHRVELAVAGRRVGAEVAVTPGRAAQLVLGSKLTLTETPAVALLTDFSGAADGLSGRLRAAAAQAVQAQKLGLLGQWGVLGDSMELLRCADAPCQQSLAERYRLRYVVTVRVSTDAEDWQLGVELFDAEVGDMASQESVVCAHCTVERAGARLSELLTQALRTGQSRPTGLLEVTSTPPGSEVLLAGVRLGQTPLRRTAFAGEHAIIVQHAGFAPYQNEVVVEPGRGAAVDATLRELSAEAPPVEPRSPSRPPTASTPAPVVPAAPPPIVRPLPGRAPRPRWRLGVGIVATLAGATLSGFGIAGLALDGRCTQTPVAAPAGELCASGRVIDSRGAGAGLLAAGLLSAGVGTALWALPGGRRLEVSAAPTPTAGITAVARGSF